MMGDADDRLFVLLFMFIVMLYKRPLNGGSAK